MNNLFNHAYPYLDEHELNLDWLIAKMKELNIRMDEFEVINSITFSGSWDITKQYPAWTIVDDGGMGYVSIQPVPAGILIGNTNYWRLIADYSVIIAGLASRITALENTVGDASSGLVKDVNDLQGDITRIDPIISNMNYYENANILILGDSLCDEGIARFQPNWVTYFRTKVTAAGGSITNYSFGGRCLSNVDVNNLIDDLPNVPSGSYTDIILFLGINDWAQNATKTQFGNAINSFDSWCHTTYPNAKVHVITPLKSEYSGTQTPELLYRFMLTKYCTNNGFNIIDAYADAPLFNGNIAALKNAWSGDNLGTHDGLHMNPDYAPYFADYVFNSLPIFKGASVSNAVEGVQLTNFFNSVAMNIYMHEDGRVVLYINLASYTPGSTLVSLGTLPDWVRPIFEKSTYNYTGGTTYAMFIVKTSGACYLLMPNTNNMPTCSPLIEYYIDPAERSTTQYIV
ncbi:MAG: SGNH/GDSL hydrolase family protein [Methanobrevibacter sp.]|nr:SGNH/GDSL hydrolase family protein [Methanobrevibacter sp.]